MTTSALHSAVQPSGDVRLRVFRGQGPREHWATFGALWRHALPGFGLGWEVNLYRLRNILNVLRGWLPLQVGRLFALPLVHGALYLRVLRANGEVLDLGLVGLRCVTTTGVNWLVDCWQGTYEPETMIYHGIGTGGAAEAAANTALTTEITTQYATDNVRPTGSLAEGASANIFRSVGTITVDGAVAATEHGLFNQASNAGGTLWDRTLFSVVNLASGDSLQVTYECTFPAAG